MPLYNVERANVRALGVWPAPSRLQLALARGSHRASGATDVAFWILIVALGLCTCAQVIAARGATHAASPPLRVAMNHPAHIGDTSRRLTVVALVLTYGIHAGWLFW